MPSNYVEKNDNKSNQIAIAISVENRKIFPPPCIYRPRWGGSPGNWVSALGIKKKTRIVGLPGRDNKFDDIFSRLDTIHQRCERTDGRTDGHVATVKTALAGVARVKIEACWQNNENKQHLQLSTEAANSGVVLKRHKTREMSVPVLSHSRKLDLRR